MIKISFKHICCFILLFASITGKSQSTHCANLDFSQGNFTNWKGYSWNYQTRLDELTSIPDFGIIYRRHEIISDTNAYDPYTGNMLKMVPSGYKFSARLGDSIHEGDNTIRNWRQSLRYTLQVDADNVLLLLKFAFVAENLYLHLGPSEHHFHFFIYDENGKQLTGCPNFEVCYSNDVFQSFQTYYIPNDPWGYTVQWMDWTTVAADLSQFIGQTITLEVLAEDCIMPDLSYISGWRTCFGYAYFVANCQPLELKQKNCSFESKASLTAPEGFIKYRWINSAGDTIGYSRILEINNALDGDLYHCRMFSILGCETNISVTLKNPSMVNADFSSDYSCDSNLVTLQSKSTIDSGSLIHTWIIDDTTLSGNNPTYQYSTSGKHNVTLISIEANSGCADLITMEVESFSPLTIGYDGYQTFCHGGTTWIKGYGTSNYQWSNGLSTDSIEIGPPGGNFWFIASSSNNKCSTDTIKFTIPEDPNWKFTIEGDTVLCPGENTILYASGSIAQDWNDKTQNILLFVSDSGRYYCTGENSRGCRKSDTISVLISPLPEAIFNLSDTIISSKKNTIIAEAQSGKNYTYIWDMGDGTNTNSGESITHTYDCSIPGKHYTCILKTTNEFGCTSFASNQIWVVPYVPNVFSPNGDRVNDIFMEGVNLQVFDRNGTIFYEGTNGWDGTYKGEKPAEPDTYFYSLSYTKEGNGIGVIKGFITLVR